MVREDIEEEIAPGADSNETIGKSTPITSEPKNDKKGGKDINGGKESVNPNSSRPAGSVLKSTMSKPITPTSNGVAPPKSTKPIRHASTSYSQHNSSMHASLPPQFTYRLVPSRIFLDPNSGMVTIPPSSNTLKPSTSDIAQPISEPLRENGLLSEPPDGRAGMETDVPSLSTDSDMVVDSLAQKENSSLVVNQ